MRVGCYKVGNERVSVMREIVAAPVLGPGLRVVGDGAVCAPRKAEFSASANDCGLPRLAASDVGVGGGAASGGGGGGPVTSAVVAGVTQGVEDGGGGPLSLVGLVAEVAKEGFIGGVCEEQLRCGSVASA